MRKFGLEVGTAYVETQTLLEPNNVIPSWVSSIDSLIDNCLQEAGDEEKKEVSNALKVLRQKFDKMHRMVAQKDDELALLGKDMKRAEGEEKIVSKDSGGANFEFERAQAELEYYEEQHDF